MRVGIATDHGGLGLKEELVAYLGEAGHEVVDVRLGTIRRQFRPNDWHEDVRSFGAAQRAPKEVWL